MLNINNEYKYFEFRSDKLLELFNNRDIEQITISSEMNCCGNVNTKTMDFTLPEIPCIHTARFCNLQGQPNCRMDGGASLPPIDPDSIYGADCPEVPTNSHYHKLDSLVILINGEPVNVLNNSYEMLDPIQVEQAQQDIIDSLSDFTNTQVTINTSFNNSVYLCVEIKIENIPTGVIPQYFILGNDETCYIKEDFNCIDEAEYLECTKYSICMLKENLNVRFWNLTRISNDEIIQAYTLDPGFDVWGYQYDTPEGLYNALFNGLDIIGETIEFTVTEDGDNVCIELVTENGFIPNFIYYEYIDSEGNILDQIVSNFECSETEYKPIECIYTAVINTCFENITHEWLSQITVLDDLNITPYAINVTGVLLKEDYENLSLIFPDIEIEQINEEEYIITYTPSDDKIPHDVQLYDPVTGTTRCVPFICSNLQYFYCENNNTTTNTDPGYTPNIGCCNLCNTTNDPEVPNKCYEPDKLEFIKNGIRIHPLFFNQQGEYLNDGIYGVTITIKTKDKIFEYKCCNYIDRLTKCNIAAITNIDQAIKAMELHRLTHAATKCNDCNCVDACLYYGNLLKTIKDAEKGNNPLMQCSN